MFIVYHFYLEPPSKAKRNKESLWYKKKPKNIYR